MQESFGKKKYIIDVKNYKIVKMIKTGGFGSIYLIENIDSKDRYAAKVIVMPENNDKFKKMINLEIGIMIQCQHPTIINFLGYSYQDFFEQQNITIIMEYAQKGSLADILKKIKYSLADIDYDNTVRQIILIGIACAMKYLHKNNIIHRDLKPDNILIDADYHPKLTDFGLSKTIQKVFSISQSMQCGTSIYMAPEMIENKRCSHKVDVYSFAILMYEVVTDSMPYPLYSEGKMPLKELQDKIVTENYRPTFNVPIKKSIQKLIERCWSADPNERPEFDEIFKKLAYNIDDSSNSEEEEYIDENIYYLDGVNEDKILSYVEEINNDDERNKTNKAINDIYQKLTDTTTKIEILTKENSQLKDENNNLKESFYSFIKENEEIKKKVESCQNENNELKNVIQLYNNEKKEMRKNIEKCMIDNQKMIKMIELYQNENKEMKNVIKKYINKKMKEVIENHQNENKEMKKDIEKCTNENQEMKAVIENHQNENIRLHDSIEDCQNEIMMLKQLSEIQPKLFNDDQDKTDSHFIHELKEAIIKEGKKIEVFNDLSLNAQKIIINNIISKEKADVYNPFLIRLEHIINYLIQLNRADITPGLKLCQRADENNQISIRHNITEILFRKGVLKKSAFTDILKEFRNVSIEFKYPSTNFNEIFNALKNLTKIVHYKIYLSVFITGIAQIDNNLSNNKYIDSVIYGDDVIEIGGPSRSFFYINLTTGPFEYCSCLSQIELPSSVTTIGCRAFYCCKSLTKIVLPNSITTIGEYAFYRCSLSYVKIPISVRSIGSYAFYDCLSNFQALIPSNFYNTKDIFPSKAIINKY